MKTRRPFRPTRFVLHGSTDSSHDKWQTRVELNWNDILVLVAKMNEKAKMPYNLKRFSGYEFRLPTEAEWRYASRGNSEDEPTWGYWWGKLPNGASKLKDAHYPWAPVSKKRVPANQWGLYYLGVKTVYADTYSVGNITTKDLCYAGDIFHYEDFEENPVRMCTGSDAAYYSVFACNKPRINSCNNPNCTPWSPFRLVYAPKLSLLNVYPRTAADGPAR